MKNKKILIKRTVLTLLWCLLLIGIIYTYTNTKEILKISSNIALKDAIQIDYQERNDKELKFSNGQLGRKIKSATIVTENGKEQIEFKDSIDERVALQMTAQYLLIKIHPTNPDTLNHLLQEELKKYHLSSKSGIIYTQDQHKQYSNNDSLTIHSSSIYFTDPYTLDIKKTASVQAWINIAPWDIITNIHLGAFWSLSALLIIMIWISTSTWNDKDSNKLLLGTMIINKEARRVTINKKECLLRNAEFNLLCMFVEKSNHTLSREEIKNAFWKEEIGVDNRVNNLVSTLRNALKHHEYQIIMDKEKGYVLKKLKAKKENNKA